MPANLLHQNQRSLALWRQLQARVDPPPELVEASAGKLFACYSAPDRHYHTLAHLEAILQTLAGLELPEASLAEVQLAGWYHDAVYNSRASDNEERSAALAREDLAGLGWSPEIQQETARLILLTRTHQTTPDDRAGQVLLDSDLAILGAEWEPYRAYADAIRQEYAWVAEQAYRSGRALVLQRFLQRSRLFLTDTMYRRFEEQARKNLQAELAQLLG